MLWILLQESSSGISAGEFWIIVFTGLTALATGGLGVLTWMAYQHVRMDAGLRRPIALEPPRSVGNVYPRDGYSDWSDLGKKEDEFTDIRVFDVYLHNRSSVAQQLFITGSIVDPDLHGEPGPWFDGTELDLAPHEGGNAVLMISAPGERGDSPQWPSDEMAPTQYYHPLFFKQQYKMRLHVETMTGHSLDCELWVKLRPFRAKFTGRYPGDL